MIANSDGADVLSFDPGVAVKHLRAADPVLGRLISEIGPFRLQLDDTKGIFGMLAKAIVYQQLTGRAAATIFARLQGLFPGSEERPAAEQILAASDEMLRGAGLSRSKVLSLRDLAQRGAAGEIPDLAEIRRMPDEEVIERLTAVRGIGRWTVEMLLIFRLGRPDILPADDYGVRKGFASAYDRELPSRKDLATYGLRWVPYRTVASWYLWRAAERATARKTMPLQNGEEEK